MRYALKTGKKLREDFPMKNFKAFCYSMYLRNCDERFDYGDATLSYEEYISKNENFLLDIFEEVCNNSNTD